MVELSITLAFIGVLLITIAIITTNIVSIYQKGTTIKAVNSVGRGLIDELTSAINSAPSVDTTSLCNSLAPNNIDACVKDHAFSYIFHASQTKKLVSNIMVSFVLVTILIFGILIMVRPLNRATRLSCAISILTAM